MKHLFDYTEHKCVQTALSMALNKPVYLGTPKRKGKYLPCGLKFRRKLKRVLGKKAAKRLMFSSRRRGPIEISWEGTGICRVGYYHWTGVGVSGHSHAVAYKDGLIYDPDPARSHPIRYQDYFDGNNFVMCKERLDK